jgi:hypothetical protein
VGMLGRMMRRGLVPSSQTQTQQQITAGEDMNVPTATTGGPRGGKGANNTTGQGRSPGRGRKGQNPGVSTSGTSQPTTWV